MPQAKIKDLRELSNEELASRLQDLKQQSVALKLQDATGQLEDTAQKRLIRREIARIQTIVSERRLKAAQDA